MEEVKKQQKAEDFIGETFNNGKLKVVGIHSVNKWTTIFRVTCTECSKDPELFPDGYFLARKSNLKSGNVSCGCSKSYRWGLDQYLLRIKRLHRDSFKINIENEASKITAHSKVHCKCNIDGYEWSATINSLLNGTSCKQCSINRNTEKSRNNINDVLAKCEKVCNERGYTFLGLVNKYENEKSKISFKCKLHGIKEMSYINFISSKIGCISCSGAEKIDKEDALFNCLKICKENNYKPIGFVDGEYINRNSRFEYECPKHGIQSVRYHCFVGKRGTRCLGCAKDFHRERTKHEGYGYGWYPHMKERKDYLYVLDFGGQYIKVGRTFNLKNRFSKLKTASGISDIKILSVYTDKHSIVFPTEQTIHNILKFQGFEHKASKWTNETFNIDCLPNLFNLLEKYSLEVFDFKGV